MKKLDYIKALEAIKLALSEVLGALKAEYFKETDTPNDSTSDSIINIIS